MSPFSDRTLYLAHAVDLGNRLLSTYQTPSGIPLSKVNLGKSVGIPDQDNRGIASLAEVASTQLELKYLSEISGDDKYWKAAEKVMQVINNQPSFDGLRPIFIECVRPAPSFSGGPGLTLPVWPSPRRRSPSTGNFVASEIRLGSRGDSYYEYLIKQYLQTDATEPIYREMYDEAMTGIKNKLVQRTKASGMVYTAELAYQRSGGKQCVPRPPSATPLSPLVQLLTLVCVISQLRRGWNLNPKQDHLVCFLGGSLMLGVTEARLSIPPNPKEFSKADLEDWYVGTGLIDTCVETYNTKTCVAAHLPLPVPHSAHSCR